MEIQVQERRAVADRGQLGRCVDAVETLVERREDPRMTIELRPMGPDVVNTIDRSGPPEKVVPEFDEIYNGEAYRALKWKYDAAGNAQTLYRKVAMAPT